jgi:UDP-glucuronate 4-epimerase
MERDSTFIDDIVEGIIRIIEKSPKNRIKKKEYYKVYNIGNNNSVKLLSFIQEIETNSEKQRLKRCYLSSLVKWKEFEQMLTN